jgi:glycosyltransferase involved in cell wall biosynthesis
VARARVNSVSVIVPTYNRADLLPRAIASALEQTCAPLEVIVVDDGSTDDTAARCREWGDRIRYLPIANVGVAGARNAGIAIAQGEWIALLDSDDAWESTKLEVQMAAHGEVPSAEWSITGCELVDGSGHSWPGPQSFVATFPMFRDFHYDPEHLFAQYLHRFEITAAGTRQVCFDGDLFGLLFLGNVGLPSSLLARRRFLRRIGSFDASLRMAEETEFFHRAAAYSAGIVVMSRLVRYRMAQGDSLTAGANAAMLTEIALKSLDAAAARRPMSETHRQARAAGQRRLLLRLAYTHLSRRDGVAARVALRRMAALGLPLGRRGTALWAASLLPAPALGALHRGKRILQRAARR